MEKLGKDMVYKNGLTELSMRDSGTKTKLKVKVLFGTLRATSMSGTSELTKLTVLVFILTLTEVATRVSGSMMFKKGKEKKFGSMAQSMSENIQTV